MPLPKIKKETFEEEVSIKELRLSKKWKLFYEKIILKSNGKYFKEEEGKKYIDKLVLLSLKERK